VETGGAGRDRTGDLLNANQALSQLSYSPYLYKEVIEADWTRPPLASRNSLKLRKFLKWRIRSGWTGKAATY
jgi:hypothetical protein